MAKIYLKFSKFSDEPLNVTDEVMKSFKEQYFDAVKSGVNLSLIFKTIEHSTGIWHGTLDKIDTKFDVDKSQRERHTFTDQDGIKRFHEKYGHIVATIVDGYGLMDRNTHFLILSEQSDLEDRGSYKVLRSLNKISSEGKHKLNDLWQEYNDRHKNNF